MRCSCRAPIAMEPPINARRRRHPRRKTQGAALAQALHRTNPWRSDVIRGQYSAGTVGGTAGGRLTAKSWRRPPRSTTETFVALRTEIDNWRWAGVPFYLRTGKRLAGRDAHIVVNFRPAPHAIFNRRRTAPTSW